MNIKNTLFVTLLLSSSFLISQSTITGVVTDVNGEPLIGANLLEKNTANGTITDIDGSFEFSVSLPAILEISFTGYETQEVALNVNGPRTINVVLSEGGLLNEVVVTGYGKRGIFRKILGSKKRKNSNAARPRERRNSESYAEINDNVFHDVINDPLSTFSVDVDAASYSNMRRYINQGAKPPADAVRIEEMVNYFNYDYNQPVNEVPFSINTELSSCPWNEEHLLLHIGLQGKALDKSQLPPSNLVFLIDVSGSMDETNKLDLLKTSFRLLVNQLRKEDRVAIVTYAGNSGVALGSTSGNNKGEILSALDRLRAGGSTSGAEGLELAYEIAQEHFMKNGNNRIVLATDGDFNVGPSSDREMKKLIKKHRKKGVYISVLGFGMGNYKDSKMETIADNGNGNYYYIDHLLEARKVLVEEFSGTFHTIAKDVKFQLEFNPYLVKEYRLIGYENRLLEEEDFEDDKKDAGDIGAGHSVTALYEIILSNGDGKSKKKYKYQTATISVEGMSSNEIVTLKLRYKKPKKRKSILLEEIVKLSDYLDPSSVSDNFEFSAAVASFGMLLRDSKFKGTSNWDTTIGLAQAGKGNDEEGYRGEMIRLIKTAKYFR